MTKALFMAPTSPGTGLTSVCLGLVRALDSMGVRVGFLKPVAQPLTDPDDCDRSIYFARKVLRQEHPDPIQLSEAQRLVSQGEQDLLMEQVVGMFQSLEESCDVVVVEGLAPVEATAYMTRINMNIARTLNAEVILVAAPGNMDPDELDAHLNLAARLYASPEDPDVIGCILNKVNAPENNEAPLQYLTHSAHWQRPQHDYARECESFRKPGFHLIGSIPWRPDLIAPRTKDVARWLDTLPIHMGDAAHRRVMRISVVARTVPNMVEQLTPGTLVVTPGDREDILIATAMAALTGRPLAGIILTGNLQPDPRTLRLCQKALDTGLPVLSTQHDSYLAANLLSRMNTEVPTDDIERVERVMDAVASALDVRWLTEQVQVPRKRRMSPAAFRYFLSKKAREADKRIVLPEGDEPRTVRAAAICHERKLARCVLLGKPDSVRSVAEAQGVQLPPEIEIVDPDAIRSRYVAPMVELRKHKGLTPQMAEAQLEDNVVLGTMMLALDEVDGLVSGAVHTTANTVRPALQLIKTRKDAKLVSSVFFMLLPDQVVVYGDCAINPDPNAEELADIAIQSAESARLFGIEPKVAMISYSTGTSGSGADVEKVRKATEIAKTLRPDLIIDGPLQYDAAANADVARIKAPNSPVAGQATIFIFPDLNTGNTTYKAVQRSANVVSIGPMLQGLRKPVNDLSRGALVDDIVFTIAITAVQATRQPGSV